MTASSFQAGIEDGRSGEWSTDLAVVVVPGVQGHQEELVPWPPGVG